MDKETQRKINRRNRNRGSRFEKSVADFLGFEVVPYSGSNARFGFGDVRGTEWLIECKNITPDEDKITLLKSWFDKNRERAEGVSKKSCIAWMPSGKVDKFIIMEDQYFLWDFDKEYVIESKVHNTKNLILHLNENYIKDVRKDATVKFIFEDRIYYMMSLQKFKRLI